MPDIQIKGLRQLEDRMRNFPAKLQKRAIKKALSAGARLVVRAAKANAPEGATGALKRNIIAKAGPKRRDIAGSTRYIIGVRHGKVNTRSTKSALGVVRKRRVSAYDKRGQDPYYYRFQERGFTAIGRAKRGSAGRKIPGRNFLRDALTGTHRAVSETFRRVLAQEIEKLER